MLEGLVANKLSDILDEYLENLNHDDLKISAGDINLRGLKLKKTALDGFDLPISIVHGQLGLFRVSIPWTSLKSSPVTVKISDVYLVVRPRSCTAHDEELSKERQRKQRKKDIEAYDTLKAQRRKAAQQKDDAKASSSGGWLSYFTDSNITQTILNNLQVQIENVHLRYEDPSDEQNPIVLGFSLGEMSLSTTDAQWTKSFLQADQIGNLVHKLVELKKLSVYCNVGRGAMMFSDIESADEFILRMKNLQASSQRNESFANDDDNRQDYILKPINGTLQATIQKSGTLDISKPHVNASLGFGDVSLQLDDMQYRALLKVLEYMTNSKRFEQFKRMRPAVRLGNKSDRQQWWQYLTWSVNKQVREEYFTWDDIKRRMDQQKSYMELYKRQQEVSYLPKLDDASKKEFDRLEYDLGFEDIVLYRELADEEIKVETKNYSDYRKQKDEALQKKKSKQGWFGGWLGGGGGDEKNDESAGNDGDDDLPLIELSQEARKKLHQSIGTDAQAQVESSTIPYDWTKIVLQFNLRKGSFGLRDSVTQKEITSAVYSQMNVTLNMREDSSAEIAVTLQTFDVLDKYSSQTKFLHILSRRGQDKSNSEQSPLVDISAETGSYISSGHDIRVRVSLEQLNFIANAPFMQRVLGFFIVPNDIDVSSIRDAAYDQVSSLQQRAETQLKLALESRKSVDAFVSIKAPSVLLPETCNAVETTPMLMADLGHFTLQTKGDPISRKKRLKEGTNLSDTDFFDRYDLSLKHIRVLISHFGNWHHEFGWLSHTPDQNLLNDINLAVEAQSRITSDIKLPKLKIHAIIPDINVTISPLRIDKLVRIFNSLVTSGLLDDPTGALDSQRRKLAEEIRIAGPLKADTVTGAGADQVLTPYWTELREDGTMLLKREATDKRIIASINLKNAKLVINNFQKGSIGESLLSDVMKENKDIQKESLLGIILPQFGSNVSEHVFILSFPSTKMRSHWLSVLKQTILSFVRSRTRIDRTHELVFVDDEDESTDTEDGALEPIMMNKKLPQETSISTSFELERFSIIINNAEQTVSEIVLSSLHVDFTQRAFDTTVQAHVKSFNIRDLWSGYSNRHVLRSGTPTGGEDDRGLIGIEFIQAEKESPLFNTDSAMRLNVKLNAVHAFFDPETISQFVRFGASIGSIIEKMKDRLQVFEAVINEKSLLDNRLDNIRRSSFKVDTILSEASLTLLDYGQSFLKLAMRNTNVKLLNTPHEMNVEGKVQALVARDMTDGVHYREILSIKNKDESLVEFQYRQDKTKVQVHQSLNTPFYDTFVTANMTSVRFVYLQRLLYKLQTYFTEGVLWETLSAGGKAGYQHLIQEQKKQSLAPKTTTENKGRMSFDLNFVDPTIVLPVSWQSDDKFIGNLGHIHVRSALDTIVKSSKDNHCETYHVSLAQMNLKSKSNGKVQRLTNKVDMKISVAMAIQAPDLPSLDLRMDVSDIELEMAHAQYQQIFRMLKGNFDDNGISTSNDNKKGATNIMKNVNALQDQGSAIASTVSSVQSNQVNNSTQGSNFVINFAKMSATLLRGSGELLGKENKLASLKIDGLGILFNSKEDNSSVCEVRMKSIDADDLRAESTSIFKNFVSFTMNQETESVDEPNPFFFFKMEMVPNAGTILKVEMADPRIVFIPEVVQEISEFFATQSAPGESLPSGTRAVVAKRLTSIQSTGELCFSQTEEYLGEDIVISEKRPLVIKRNKFAEVIINGDGHTIHFDNTSSSTEPFIIIPDGMTLRFKNVRLLYARDFSEFVSKGQNIHVSAATTERVIHERTGDEELKQRLKSSIAGIEAKAASDKENGEASPVNGSEGNISFSGQFGSPSLLIPEDENDPHTRFFVVRSTLTASFNRNGRSENGRFFVEYLEAFAEDSKTRARGAPIIDAVGVSALLTTPDIHASSVERTIELNITEKDDPTSMETLRLRLSYQDAKMMSNVVSKFGKKSSKEEMQKILEEQLLKHGDNYLYEHDQELDFVETSIDFTDDAIESLPQIVDLYSDDDDDGDDDGSDNYDDDDDDDDEFYDHSEGSDIFLNSDEEKKLDEQLEVQCEENENENQQSKTEAIDSQSEEEQTSDQFTEYYLTFNSRRSISLLIVDDLKGWDVPLLDVNLSNMSLDNAYINLKNGKFIVGLNLTIDSSYYNLALADFEPILEPCSIAVAASRIPKPLPRDPKATITICDVRMPENEQNPSLNINISRNMMDSIMNTLLLWKEDFSRSTKSISQRFDPFVVRNHTGRQLCVRKKTATASRKQHQWTLQMNETQGLNFDEQYSRSSSAKQQLTAVFVERCDLEVEVDGFPSIVVNARRVSASSVLSHDKKLVCLIVVTEFEGRKFITARSGFSVQNDTTVPVEIGIHSNSDCSANAEVTSIGIVEPNANKGVPLIDNLTNTYFSIRPTDGKHHWSPALDSINFLNLMKLDNTRLFECKPAHEDGSHPFFAVARISTQTQLPPEIKPKIRKSNAWHKMQRLNYCIQIIPPLCISNMLRSELSYSVYSSPNLRQSKELISPEKTLTSTEAHYIYTANPSQSLMMKAVLNEPKWHSKKIALLSSNQRPAEPLTTRFSIIDDHGNRLFLNIDYEYNARAFRHAVVFTPYWIVNHSGQSLYVYDGEKIAAGNHLFSSMHPNQHCGHDESVSKQSLVPLPFSFLDPNANIQEQKIRIATDEHVTTNGFALSAAVVPQAVDLQEPKPIFGKTAQHISIQVTANNYVVADTTVYPFQIGVLRKEQKTDMSTFKLVHMHGYYYALKSVRWVTVTHDGDLELPLNAIDVKEASLWLVRKLEGQSTYSMQSVASRGYLSVDKSGTIVIAKSDIPSPVVIHEERVKTPLFRPCNVAVISGDSQRYAVHLRSHHKKWLHISGSTLRQSATQASPFFITHLSDGRVKLQTQQFSVWVNNQGQVHHESSRNSGGGEYFNLQTTNKTQIALKSIYSKWFCADQFQAVVANRQALGPWEQWSVTLASPLDPNNCGIPRAPTHLTMTSTTAPGKFKRTQIINISSRYVVINRLDEQVQICQAKSTARETTVESNMRKGLVMWEKQDSKAYEAQFRTRSCPWSSAFRLDQLGDIPLKLGSVGMNVNLQEENGVIYVVIESIKHVPFIVRNMTSYALQFSQTGLSKKKWWNVLPRSSEEYWWDDANSPSTLSFKVKSQPIPEEIDPKRVSSPTRLISVDKASTLWYSVEARGPTRTLKIFTRESAANKEESTEKLVEFELMICNVSIPKIGISLMDMQDEKIPEELLYITIDKINVYMKQTNKNTYVQATVKALQIDNQLFDAHYPVVLAMTYATKDAPPMINLSLAMQNRKKDDDVLIFPGLQLAVQEIDTFLTSDLIIRLLGFFGTLFSETSASEKQQIESEGSIDEDIRSLDNYLVVSMEPVQRAQRVYFSRFELHPLRIHVSFKTTEVFGDEFRNNPIILALNQGAGAVINFDNVDLGFDLLALDSHFSTSQELQSLIVQHYTRGFFFQLFKVLLSFEAIGNPIGLVKNIGSGVRDLFYEPASAVINNPSEFTGAVVKGTSSFASKSLQSSANSASKVSGTIANALGALSFDRIYLKEREQASRKKASNLGEGLGEGFRGLGRGVADGATGLVRKPIQGASRGGFGGFLKGIGIGIVGIPVKPIAGVVDLVTKTSEGISNIGKEQKERKRYPRAFRLDGALVTYNKNHAQVEYALRANHTEERALAYAILNRNGEVAVLSHSALHYVTVNRREIQWKVPLHEIVSISVSTERSARSAEETTTVIITTRPMSETREIIRQLRTSDGKESLLQFKSVLFQVISKDTTDILAD